MAGTFETQFITASDKPALIAFSTPDWLDAVKVALRGLNYKVHTAATHSDFLVRFSQIRYQVVVVEELFGAETLEENSTLLALQKMPMHERRHATIILLGNTFQTFAPMEAFQHSVHAVINSSEMFMLKQLIEKAAAENALFLQRYLEVQNRISTL
jgi:hypothetical protein